MDLTKMFKKPDVPVEEIKEPELPNRIQGKIYHLDKKGKGFGFIESDKLPQKRIYFLWKSLSHNTREFSQLKIGDVVEFTPRHSKEKGWSALRIQVLD